METLSWLNYGDLSPSSGGFSKLFVDYVGDFQKVQQYFEHDFRSRQNFPKQIARIQSHYRHRSALVETLKDQNRRFGCPESTFASLDLLADEKTFAVVTGQQVGMLGGPLYTVYKTLTAISLCRQLRQAFPEYNFVPVFWLEGEDHDFEEVNKVGLLNQENIFVKIEYLLSGKPAEKNMGAVGELILDGSLQAFLEEVSKCLHNSEFKPAVLEMLQQSYNHGATFNSAFVKLMNTMFRDDGLVYISVNDKRFKQLLSPVFQKELQAFPRVSQLIIQRSAELEDRYHAQIKTKALNLFLFHKGGRYVIEPREHDFSLKGTRHFLSKDELLKIATETPELLSPNVALRPICQDTLLPTVAYVAGPSEVAYFAQLRTVYQFFDLPMPVIYPRSSATLLEGRSEKILEKFEIDINELFTHREEVQRKVVEMVSEVKIDEMFSGASQRLTELMNEMKFGLNYIDATLMGPLEATREKIDSHLAQLKEKVQVAQERKHEVALRQINKTANTLLPNGSLQERELNITYFLNKYGMGFPRSLMETLAIDKFQHQIIRL
ncbi:MAG TPA: bacillithiol biosynthesis cysteine-adding enzyme BshC [Bacteroidota bacterium]|jgi:bacillithiol biosynthesis cysteine-adding enzyme BshC|nr:bacillithiol biosynthesis cysteine-adding enzyme BshC [Bacteroidota bacterium]